MQCTALHCTNRTESQSQSYFMTGGLPPIGSSWRQALWDSRPEFFQRNLCDNSPYVTSSLTRRWVCLLWYEYAWPFVKCTFRTYSLLLKILPFALHTSPLSLQALQDSSCLSCRVIYSLGADHTENTASNNTSIVSRGQLPSNGSNTVAYLWSCCLAMTVVSLFVSRSLSSNGSTSHNTFWITVHGNRPSNNYLSVQWNRHKYQD
jgi:hypothetical protein